MLIKSLKMKDFRQFKGTTAVEFSCNPNQNVTIILGDNTYGKTTLLQAFNWCFYETVRFLYKGIIINHNKKPSQPTLKRRFFKKKAAFFLH